MGIFRAAFEAAGPIEAADFSMKLLDESLCALTIGIEIQVLDFLPHNPVGHGIDVVADHIAPEAIGFEQRGASPHEGIGDTQPRQIVGMIIRLGNWSLYEFGKKQPAKKGAGPSGKPLVHGDNRPVVLLNLLLLQRQSADEGYVKVAFDHLTPDLKSVLSQLSAVRLFSHSLLNCVTESSCTPKWWLRTNINTIFHMFSKMFQWSFDQNSRLLQLELMVWHLGYKGLCCPRPSL